MFFENAVEILERRLVARGDAPHELDELALWNGRGLWHGSGGRRPIGGTQHRTGIQDVKHQYARRRWADWAERMKEKRNPSGVLSP